jgi:cytoskeleton protein RodZ
MQKTTKQNIENMAATSASEPVAEVIPLPEVALPAAERQAQTEVVDAQTAVNAADAKDTLTQVLPSVPAIPPKVEPASKPPVNSPAINNPSVVTQNLQLPKEVTVDYNTLKEKAVQKGSLPGVAGSADAKAKVPELANSGLKTDSSIAAIKGVNLAVTEQTWVRVTDKSGAVVYEKMLQANSEDGFNGLPPFKMLIGNAKATKLTFLGQDIDLTSKTRNNVARLTLE